MDPLPIVNPDPAIVMYLDPQTSETKKVNPGYLRDQKVITYFCGKHSSDLGDYLLTLPKYHIPFTSIQCYLGHIRSCYFHVALNGSLVGLSSDSSFTPSTETQPSTEVKEGVLIPKAAAHPKLLRSFPVIKNIGIGIVQAIDLNKNEVIIITPLSAKEMESVNTLIRSTEIIPQSLLQNVQCG